jgi:hypothetical protein
MALLTTTPKQLVVITRRLRREQQLAEQRPPPAGGDVRVLLEEAAEVTRQLEEQTEQQRWLLLQGEHLLERHRTLVRRLEERKLYEASPLPSSLLPPQVQNGLVINLEESRGRRRRLDDDNGLTIQSTSTTTAMRRRTREGGSVTTLPREVNLVLGFGLLASLVLLVYWVSFSWLGSCLCLSLAPLFRHPDSFSAWICPYTTTTTTTEVLPQQQTSTYTTKSSSTSSNSDFLLLEREYVNRGHFYFFARRDLTKPPELVLEFPAETSRNRLQLWWVDVIPFDDSFPDVLLSEQTSTIQTILVLTTTTNTSMSTTSALKGAVWDEEEEDTVAVAGLIQPLMRNRRVMEILQGRRNSTPLFLQSLYLVHQLDFPLSLRTSNSFFSSSRLRLGWFPICTLLLSLPLLTHCWKRNTVT